MPSASTSACAVSPPRLRLTHFLLFCLLFGLGTGAHYLTRPYLGPIVNQWLNAAVAARLINLFSPQEAVRASGSLVGSARASILVAQGCEGVDVMLMVVAAVVAFPLGARKKVLGAAAGALVVYTFNLGRIVGLWYCLRHWPASFDSMHLVVGQTVLIVVGVVFFAAWTGVLGPARG